MLNLIYLVLKKNQPFLNGSMRVNYSLNIQHFFFVIYVTLNVKPPKKCMYIWFSSIACPKFTSLYINYMTNIFVLVVQKKDSWYYDSSKKNKLVKSTLSRGASLVYFWAYILGLWVYLSQIYCLLLHPTSSICESILVKSVVYFSSLHFQFLSLFQSSLLYFF